MGVALLVWARLATSVDVLEELGSLELVIDLLEMFLVVARTGSTVAGKSGLGLDHVLE